MIDLNKLQENIKYSFKNENLLLTAVTHSSYANEPSQHQISTVNNERLEFLGDAVLELSVSDHLFKEMKDKREGDLSRIRASIVCEPTLAFFAKKIDLSDFLLLGKGEEASGGRYRDSITSDAFEAVIGAIYLDGGFTNAKKFVDEFVLDDIEHATLFFDSKSILQEYVQGIGDDDLTYDHIKVEGPPHCRTFYVRVLIGDKEFGQGQGSSKKSAEQQAAYNTLVMIKNNGVKS